MVKVSVVMPVYNASRFLNNSVTSILNQSLDDLELICVDDGSTDNSLEILNEFKENDSRVKVFSRTHEGGGNARNYGLEKVTGKYLFCMDADDILDLNAFDDFYYICEEKNLDFLVFKAINYGVEKDHYFETEYQNMTSISKLVKDNVFNYKDLGDLLFDFNVSPWCKFCNAEFIKKTGAKFRENSKFHDNQFFWDIIFQAKRIYFIDEFYYTRYRYDDSLTASGDINHMNIIGVVNDIIKLFKKHNQLENYKHLLYSLKVTWIYDRYNQIQEKYKELFFNEMKSDFEKEDDEFINELDDKAQFIYHCVRICDSYSDFDTLQKFDNKKSLDKIQNLNSEISRKNECIKELSGELKECISIIKEDEIRIKRITSENSYFKNQNKDLKILNVKLIEELEYKNRFRNIFSKNKKKLL